MFWIHDPISYLLSLSDSGFCVVQNECTCVGGETLVSDSKCKKKVIKPKKKKKDKKKKKTK